MKVFILGSGATAGTLPSCPTTPGFGTALQGRLAPKRLEGKYPELAKVVADLWPEQKAGGSAWDLAHAWTLIDYFSKFPSLRCGGDYGPQASFELHAALLEVYGRKLCDDLEALLQTGNGFTLLDIVAEVRPGDVVVSFNWDVSVEIMAAKMGVQLVQAPHLVTMGVSFIKLHGSVSWPRTIVPPWIVNTRATPAPCREPMEPDDVIKNCVEHPCNDCRQPFVIGAVPIKTELIGQFQGGHAGSPYTVLMEQWKCFMDALAAADEVVIAGYNFPDDDGYGRFLVKEAIARRGRLLRRLYFYELDKAQVGMSAKLDQIFKPGTTPIFRGPVTRYA